MYGITGNGLDRWDLDLFLGNGNVQNIASVSCDDLIDKYPQLSTIALYLKAKSLILDAYNKKIVEQPL